MITPFRWLHRRQRHLEHDHVTRAYPVLDDGHGIRIEVAFADPSESETHLAIKRNSAKTAVSRADGQAQGAASPASLGDGSDGGSAVAATTLFLIECDVPDLDLVGLLDEHHNADHLAGVEDLEELASTQVAAHVPFRVVSLEKEREVALAVERRRHQRDIRQRTPVPQTPAPNGPLNPPA